MAIANRSGLPIAICATSASPSKVPGSWATLCVDWGEGIYRKLKVVV